MTTLKPPETNHLTLQPDRITRTWFMMLVGLTLLSLLGLLAVFNPRFEIVRRLFELDQEQSVATWVAGVLLFVGGLLVMVIAREHIRRKRPYARHWFYLSVIFTLLSLDETAELHEQLIQLKDIFNTTGIFMFAWVIPALIVVGGFVLTYARFTLALPPPIRKWFAISMGMYIGGALGMEMFNGWFLTNVDPQSPVPYLLLTTFEEILEKVGSILFIYTMLRYLRDYCEVSIVFANPISHKVID